MAIITESRSLHFRCGSVSIDDIFVSSFGYEQTNILFYQVIAVRGQKTAVLRRISSEIVRGKSGYSGEKKPLPHAFTEEAITRRIRDQGDKPMVVIDEGERAYKSSPGKAHHFTSYA